MRKSKDYAKLRENDDTYKQKRSSHAFLKDYSLKHKVEMYRNMSKESTMDKVFILKIDDKKIYLDAEEFMMALRWV